MDTSPSVSQANIYSLLQDFITRYLGFWQILTDIATIPMNTDDPYLMPTTWLGLKIVFSQSVITSRTLFQAPGPFHILEAQFDFSP